MSKLGSHQVARWIASVAAAITLQGTAWSQNVNVIEFYNPALDHYFISALAADIVALDSGHFAGWTRTGYSFNATDPGIATPVGASPVCRFYGLPSAGLDSHFYSASPAECAAVQQKFPNAWELESSNVFQIYLPNLATGACQVGTQPIYRAWNNRADSNHRYTTSAVVQAQMVAKGYIAEGYGNPPVVMCAPQGGTATFLIGTVAMGSPVPGATVTVKDSLGQSRATTSAADGTYAIDLSALSAPLVAVAVGNFPSGNATLVSVLDGVSPGTSNYLNITPWTTAIAAALSTTGNARDLDPQKDFSAIMSSLGVVEAYSVKLMAPMLAAAGYGSVSTAKETSATKSAPIYCLLNGIARSCGPLRTPFVANHTGYDGIYDRIAVGLTPKGGIFIGNRCTSTDGSNCFHQPVYSDPAPPPTPPNENICGSDIGRGTPIQCNLPTPPTGDNLLIACSSGCIALGGPGISYGQPDKLPSQDPLPVPGVSPHCTVTASNLAPMVGSTIVLTAVCSNNPTSYSWSNCASTTNTCTTTSANPGAITYTVTAVTSAGTTPPSGATVTWQPKSGVAEVYKGTLTLTETWGALTPSPNCVWNGTPTDTLTPAQVELDVSGQLLVPGTYPITVLTGPFTDSSFFPGETCNPPGLPAFTIPPQTSSNAFPASTSSGQLGSTGAVLDVTNGGNFFNLSNSACSVTGSGTVSQSPPGTGVVTVNVSFTVSCPAPPASLTLVYQFNLTRQ